MRRYRKALICLAAALLMAGNAAAAYAETGPGTAGNEAEAEGVIAAPPGSETMPYRAAEETAAYTAETAAQETQAYTAETAAQEAAGPGVSMGPAFSAETYAVQETQPYTAETAAAQEVPAWQAGFARDLTFEADRFQVPAGTRTLVVVEGFALGGGRAAYQEGYVSDPSRWNRIRLTAYSRGSDTEPWARRVQSPGVMGWNGMSSSRRVGNGQTPIGLFLMDTPFGRLSAKAGFPADYIEIMTRSADQYWSEVTNRFEVNGNILMQKGERLYESWAARIYNYCINMGFNKDNANGNGSALFLHCTKDGKPSTAGCVAVEETAMAAILRLYAQGPACIALSYAGQFDPVYAAYNDTGASPAGEFAPPAYACPETPLIIDPALVY